MTWWHVVAVVAGTVLISSQSPYAGLAGVAFMVGGLYPLVTK